MLNRSEIQQFDAVRSLGIITLKNYLRIYTRITLMILTLTINKDLLEISVRTYVCRC